MVVVTYYDQLAVILSEAKNLFALRPAANSEKRLMQITVQLLATYRRYLPPAVDYNEQDSYLHDVAPGTTVGDLLASLPLTPNELYTFLVNGRHAERHQILQANDLLTVFPPAGGG